MVCEARVRNEPVPQVVLDLGSGGGIDVILSAKRVVRTEKHTAWK